MGTIASVLQWYCTKCNYLNPTESVCCLRCRTSRKANGNVGSLLHHPILATSGNATSGPVSSSCVRMKDVNSRKLVSNDCLFRVIDSLALAHKHINRKKIERSFVHPVPDPRCCWNRKRHLSQPSINRKWNCHRCRVYNRTVSWHCINCEALSVSAPVYKDTIRKPLTPLACSAEPGATPRTADHYYGGGGGGSTAVPFASLRLTPARSMEQFGAAARCRFCIYNQFSFEGDTAAQACCCCCRREPAKPARTPKEGGTGGDYPGPGRGQSITTITKRTGGLIVVPSTTSSARCSDNATINVRLKENGKGKAAAQTGMTFSLTFCHFFALRCGNAEIIACLVVV
uniref:RanBP2-type domain-containing protein n=1 Tax=Anopheles melas TaxID=34690 RepID=A0A182TY79_9DIPT